MEVVEVLKKIHSVAKRRPSEFLVFGSDSFDSKIRARNPESRHSQIFYLSLGSLYSYVCR